MQSRERVRAEVDLILTAQDPEGLLSYGAPADEYEFEVEALTDLVCAGRVDHASVFAVWEHWFGPGSVMARRPDFLEWLTTALLDRPA